MTKSKKDRATAENAILRFLVECCDEGPGLEVSGMAVTAAYVRLCQRANAANSTVKWGAVLPQPPIPYLNDYAIYSLLCKSGFQKETREEAGRNGAINKAVYFLGLGLRAGANELPVRPPSPPTAEERPEPPPEYTEVPEPPTHHNPHISVNGTLYKRDLIATVRPIRGFIKHGTGEQMAAIVTFTNPEIKHQFVNAEELSRIKREIGEIGRE